MSPAFTVRDIPLLVIPNIKTPILDYLKKY